MATHTRLGFRAWNMVWETECHLERSSGEMSGSWCLSAFPWLCVMKYYNPKIRQAVILGYWKTMTRELQGHYVTISTVGEEVRAFVPAPLPPKPPIEWTPELHSKFDQALLVLGRLDSSCFCFFIHRSSHTEDLCFTCGAHGNTSFVYPKVPQKSSGTIPLRSMVLSTNWRTSARHQRPLGFLVAHWHPPFFFSDRILFIMVDLPFLTTSCSMSEAE